MEVFIAILVLVTLGLFTTLPAFYRVRKSRWLQGLHAGGWLALLAGLAMGPNGVGLIDESAIRSSLPLVQVGVGWIGFMIGLQFKREVLSRTPAGLWRHVMIDAVISAGLIGLSAWLVWVWFTGDGSGLGGRPETSVARIGAGLAVMGGITLAAASIGWSMETRSVGFGEGGAATAGAMAIRVGGGLAAAIAIVVHGLGFSFVSDVELSVIEVLLRVGMLVSLAVGAAAAAAVLGWYGLREAGRERDSQLTVFLGMVAVVAGLATQTSADTLLASLLAGIIIANLPGKGLREFERFVLRGEHAVAAMFSLLAGVLIAWPTDRASIVFVLALVGVVVVVRVMSKSLVAWWSMPGLVAGESGVVADRGALDGRSRRLGAIASMRQSPVAIALGVSVVLIVPTESSQIVLTIVVAVGLACEVLALLAGRGEALAQPAAAAVAASGDMSDGDAVRGRLDETGASGVGTDEGSGTR